MKTALLILVLTGVGVTWWTETLTATRLAVELDARRAESREMAALLRERERLRSLAPNEDELGSLRRAAAERAQLQAALDRQEAEPAPQTPKLTLGDWRPARDWKDRGQTTPHATIETALWAAAGGDVAALRNLLSLDDATRTKAAMLLARLPAGERERYPSPEDLIAAFTIKAIPVGEAQLVWLNEADPDHAAAGVFLKNPPTETGAVDFAATPPALKEDSRERPPPQLPSQGTTAVAYLSLRREGDTWRLVVPPNAVDRIAKDLAVKPIP
jgi:hypothetical protein